jgi:hypothetical protein
VKRKLSPTKPPVIFDSTGLSPEWMRISHIPMFCGLSRSHIWLKITDRTLESIHVKAPGATRGVRLVSVASLRKYLNSFVHAA